MQAVILTAGVATRLNKEKSALPKGLIGPGVKPLLEYSLLAFDEKIIL